MRCVGVGNKAGLRADISHPTAPLHTRTPLTPLPSHPPPLPQDPEDEDFVEFIDSLRITSCQAWCAFLQAYFVSDDAAPAARAAHVARAKAELLDRRTASGAPIPGAAQDMALRAGSWAAAWQHSAAAAGQPEPFRQVQSLENAVSLELEQKVLALVVDLVQALSREVAAPLFGPHTGALVWLAGHCHYRQLREGQELDALSQEERTKAIQRTFSNDVVAVKLGLPQFGAWPVGAGI